MTRCPDCGTPLRVRRNRRYRYRESGLDQVVLTGIRTYWCPKCRQESPEIPNILGLHREIAIMLVSKPSPLTPAEFRFLRKEMGLKAKDLAPLLGTTDVNLSRWETGNTPINPAADRLLRLLYTLHTIQAGRAIEPANFVQAALKTLETIASTRRPKPLALRIPAQEVAGAGAR